MSRKNPRVRRQAQPSGTPPVKSGVRGWLLLVCLLLVLGAPGTNLAVIQESLALLDKARLAGEALLVRDVSLLAYGKCALAAVFGLSGLAAGIGLFLKKPWGLQLARLWWFLAPAPAAAAMLLVDFLDFPGWSVAPLQREALIDLTRQALVSIACLLYLGRSKRVKATYGS